MGRPKKNKDPENTMAKPAPQSNPSVTGEYTREGIVGKTIILGMSEIFFKIPDTDIFMNRLTDTPVVSAVVPKTISDYGMYILISSLRAGKIMISENPESIVAKTASAVLMNPDQWSITAHNIVDLIDVEKVIARIKDEDNLMILEKCLEVELAENNKKRQAVIEAITEQIKEVKK